MQYRIKRMRRKTTGIYITEDGSVEIRAPYGVPEAEIDRFAREKEDWIRAHQAAVRERNRQREAYCLQPGGSLLFLGRERPLAPSQTNRLTFDGERFLIPDAPMEILRPAVAALYRQAARQLLPEIAARYTPLVGREPAQIRISSAKTRWGSCSAQGGLSFSWRLMFATPGAIDYVVVHELAHLVEFNHSPRFWALVEAILPDWRERRQSLAAIQETLQRQGW